MGTKVTNLTPAPASSELQKSLVLDDYSGGLRVERYNLAEAGIGPAVDFYFTHATDYRQYLTAAAGIIPVKGSQLQSIQYVQTKAELQRLPVINHAPLRASDLDAWAVGDSVNYLTEGGVIFFAGVNYLTVGASVTGVAKGTWSVLVQKNYDNQVYVKVSRARLNSYAVALNGPLTSLGVSDFKNIDRNFSFNLNLSTDIGRKSYEDLLKGNIAGVQDIASQNQYKNDVQFVESNQITSRGKFFNFFFGIPILANFTWSSGKINSLSLSNVTADNSKVSVNYGIYTRESRNKFFSNHTDKTVTFIGTNYSVIDSEQNVSKGYFGQYTIDLGEEKSSASDIRGFMDEIVSKTGLRKQVKLEVPKLPSGHYDYAGAHLEVIFSQEQTDYMIKFAETSGQANFISTNTNYASSYFNYRNNPWNICPMMRQEDHDNCQEATISETRSALKNMWNSLHKMKSLKDDPEGFAAAYAEFGKGLAQNAFTLQAALVLAGQGTEIYYRMEGARISLYELYLKTTQTAGEFQVISSPGQALPVAGPTDRADRDRGLLVSPRHVFYSPVNP